MSEFSEFPNFLSFVSKCRRLPLKYILRLERDWILKVPPPGAFLALFLRVFL